MKKKRNFLAADTLIILLAVSCIALTVLLALAKPAYLIPFAAVVLLVLLALSICLQRIRAALRRLFFGVKGSQTGAMQGLYVLSAPLVAVSGEKIIWHNSAFLQFVTDGAEVIFQPISKVVPGFSFAASAMPQGQNLDVNGMYFTARSSTLPDAEGTYFVVFSEDTQLKLQSEEYLASRPAVLYFVIDTYDDVLKEMRESERAMLIAGVDLAIEQFVGSGTGFLRRVSSSTYLAVVEERHVQQMIEGRFSVLDEVRSEGDELSLITLSIGVGHRCKSLLECEQAAQRALDMALGRGGDQAAVKNPDGFEFYGGVARSVEKRTKVKSRIVSKAMQELFGQYSRVFIMGHKMSDMDSLGAAVGMLSFARMCKVSASIVVDKPASQAGSLLDYILSVGYGQEIITPAEAAQQAGNDTLLVVVDTHMPHMIESEEVYRKSGATVVIDHHRRMVGHIDDAVLFYHEPYASSTCELVSELLQHISNDTSQKPLPAEADALLAGIILDTRTFSLNVGVRTFEAAAWLRKVGAQTEMVKKLFASPLNDYLYRSHLVSEAVIFNGCAVSLSDKVPPDCEVVAPQAANDLLSIKGVQASFVGILVNNQVRISARSMGEINVQLILEKIGGGGHLTMAGAQMKDANLQEARSAIEKAIASYMQETKAVQSH